MPANSPTRQPTSSDLHLPEHHHIIIFSLAFSGHPSFAISLLTWCNLSRLSTTNKARLITLGGINFLDHLHWPLSLIICGLSWSFASVASFDHHLIIIVIWSSFDHLHHLITANSVCLVRPCKSRADSTYWLASLSPSHFASQHQILTGNSFLFVNQFSLGQLYFFFVCAFQPAPKSTESEIALNCRRQISTSKKSLKVSLHLKFGATDTSLVRILETLPIFFSLKSQKHILKVTFFRTLQQMRKF